MQTDTLQILFSIFRKGIGVHRGPAALTLAFAGPILPRHMFESGASRTSATNVAPCVIVRFMENAAMDPRVALRTCSLFADFSGSDLDRIASISRVKTYQRSEEVFREGDAATRFFAVVTGKVKLYKLSREGKYHIVRLVSRGELFAEAAAFSGEQYPVFAEAVTKTNLLSIEAKPFLDIVLSDRRLALKVIASLSRRLESVVSVLGQLALADLTARLAKYILDLSLAAQQSGMDGSLVRLDIRKADLAARLGTVSESLSRSLAKLRQKETIKVKGNEIRILDRGALARIAAGFHR
jgi:CRP-like cAMP-binding protein